MLAGRYKVTRVQRITGLSALYEAHDMKADGTSQRCAVKEESLEARLPDEIADMVKRFERRAAALKTLAHPAIPRILDGFVIDGQAYLVMDYVEGKDLEDVINEARAFLPIPTVYRWAVELCDVLNYLHTRQPQPLVFRDIKPSNIMIDAEKHVKLIDYGIAEVYEAGEEYPALGTDGYAAPEQYEGIVSPLIDMYALGATLHHLLTRTDPRLQPPFSFGKRPIRTYNAAVPWELGAIVMRALAFNPEDRFASMAEMLEMLRKIEGRVIP